MKVKAKLEADNVKMKEYTLKMMNNGNMKLDRELNCHEHEITSLKNEMKKPNRSKQKKALIKGRKKREKQLENQRRLESQAKAPAKKAVDPEKIKREKEDRIAQKLQEQ